MKKTKFFTKKLPLIFFLTLILNSAFILDVLSIDESVSRDIVKVINSYCNAWIRGNAKEMYQFLIRPTVLTEEEYVKDWEGKLDDGKRPIKIININDVKYINNTSYSIVVTLEVPPSWYKPCNAAQFEYFLELGIDDEWGITGSRELVVKKEVNIAELKEIVRKEIEFWMAGDVHAMYQLGTKPITLPEEQFVKDMAEGLKPENRPKKIISISEPEHVKGNMYSVIAKLAVPESWIKPDNAAKIKYFLLPGADNKWGLTGQTELSLSLK
ncbi:MAG: hypothetical protein ABH952_05795 [Candidatus Omnitrophota bacterium]